MSQKPQDQLIALQMTYPLQSSIVNLLFLSSFTTFYRLTRKIE